MFQSSTARGSVCNKSARLGWSQARCRFSPLSLEDASATRYPRQTAHSRADVSVLYRLRKRLQLSEDIAPSMRVSRFQSSIV